MSRLRLAVVLALVAPLALPAKTAATIGTPADRVALPNGVLALAVRDAMGPVMLATSSAPQAPPSGDDWDWAESGSGNGGDGTKSGFRAVVSSALLPGLGESYLGYKNRAKIFYGIEAVIWAGVAFYTIQAEDRQDRQIEFAELNASAPGDGNSDYYEHIGLWISLEEWHDIVRRDARLNYPDDPAAQEEYFEENKRYDQGDFWEWQDDDDRTEYRQLRSQAERSYRNGRLLLGAAVFNRIASMVDALALTRVYNNRVREEKRAELELRLVPRSTVDGLVIGPVLNARY